MNQGRLRHIFLVLTFSLVTSRVFGQKLDNLIIKYAPLGIVDPYGQNIHFGIEFLGKSKVTYETDFAIYIPNYFKNDETPRIKDRKGFKIKPEIRFYPNYIEEGQSTQKGFYIASELFFVKDNFKRGDSFVDYDEVLDTGTVYFDFDIINRFEIGNNFKVGYQMILGESVSVDTYVGIGLKYYNTKYEYRITDAICCPTMRFFEVPVGLGLRMNFTIGVKIGLIL